MLKSVGIYVFKYIQLIVDVGIYMYMCDQVMFVCNCGVGGFEI